MEKKEAAMTIKYPLFPRLQNGPKELLRNGGPSHGLLQLPLDQVVIAPQLVFTVLNAVIHYVLLPYTLHDVIV